MCNRLQPRQFYKRRTPKHQNSIVKIELVFKMASTQNLSQCSALSGLDFYLRPLSVADVKSCVIVESAFPEHERCSEEKVPLTNLYIISSLIY